MKRTKSKISSVAVLKKNDINPILVKFQNGDLLPGSHENLDCQWAVDKTRKRDNQKLLAACDSSVYIGNIEQDPEMSTFLAIRNSVTGKMRLVQVETCSMLSEHVLRVREDSAARTADSSQQLYTQFGGKKAIKAHDKYNRMKVNVDIVKDHLDSTLEKHEARKEEEPNENPYFAETKDNPIVPPMNKEAKNIRDLYSITEILSTKILLEIESVVEEVLKTSPEDLPIDSKFILSRIQKIQQSNAPDSPENKLKTKALIYLDALIALVKVPKGQSFAKVSLSGICDNVERDIRKNFCDPKSTRLFKTAFTARKSICHILILGILLTDTMEISIEEMTRELKTTNKKELLEFAIYLGLKISANKDILGLKMPSQMDEKRRMKPERKRKRN